MPTERLRRESDVATVGLYYCGDISSRRDGRPTQTWRMEVVDLATGQQGNWWQTSRAGLELLHDVLSEFLGRAGPGVNVVEVRVVHVAPAAPALEVEASQVGDPDRDEINAIKEEMRRAT